MKKIFATILVVCFVFVESNAVYALTPSDLQSPEERVQDEYLNDSAIFYFVSNWLREYTLNTFQETGEKVTWVMHNLNDERKLRVYIIHQNGDIKQYKYSITCNSCKYFRVGGILQNPYPEDLGFAFKVNMKTADNLITRNQFTEEAEGYGRFQQINIDTYFIETVIVEESKTNLITSVFE